MHGGLPGHSGRIPYLSVLARMLWGRSNTWNQEFPGLWKMVKVIFELKDVPCSRHFWWFWKPVGRWGRLRLCQEGLPDKDNWSVTDCGGTLVGGCVPRCPTRGVLHSRGPLPSGSHVGLLPYAG